VSGIAKEKSFAIIVTCGTVAAGWLVEVDGELVEVLAPQAASRLATISNMKALPQSRRLTMECMLNILETPLLFLGTLLDEPFE